MDQCKYSSCLLNVKSVIKYTFESNTSIRLLYGHKTFELDKNILLIHTANLNVLKNGPIPASFCIYFRSFHIPIQMTNIQFEQYKLKKV